MAYLPLKIPPGVYRIGTEYEAKGRYYDANLVRWIDGALRPVGGWRKRSSGQVTGAARAMVAWRDNNSTSRIAVGTHTGLFIQTRAGAVHDITPVDFNIGRANATSSSGFGSGTFGTGAFGTPRADATLVLDATVWTLDTWGQNLVGVSPDDRIIYEWALVLTDRAVPVANAPDCAALVVTPERILMALGADGDPRKVKWCGQENNTDWTPTAVNQAGSFPLQTGGSLMCGKPISAGTLLFTDTDVWLASYRGDQFVYSFSKQGSGCGVISRQAVAAIDAQAVWMGRSSFWLYNGYVQPLPCDVADYVFADMNRAQVSKTYAVRNSAYNEIEWHYCSESSVEIDRCVVWNYVENYWNIGRPNRTCGTDKGVFTYQVMADIDGFIYEHEVGNNYDGQSLFAESGPLEIGNGDTVLYASHLAPDERTAGQVSATFKSRLFPNGDETIFGPYSLHTPTPIRVTGRQVKVRYDAVTNADWRVGTPRLEVLSGGRR